MLKKMLAVKKIAYSLMGLSFLCHPLTMLFAAQPLSLRQVQNQWLQGFSQHSSSGSDQATLQFLQWIDRTRDDILPNHSVHSFQKEQQQHLKNIEYRIKKDWENLIPKAFWKLANQVSKTFPLTEEHSLEQSLDQLYYQELSNYWDNRNQAVSQNMHSKNVSDSFQMEIQYPFEQAQRQVALATHSGHLFVEALDPLRHLVSDDVHVQMISKENDGVSTRDQGWSLVSAREHWPTLFWSDPHFLPVQEIPLFQKNTLMFLQKAYLKTTSSQAGILFGQVAPGWQVDLAESHFLEQTDTIFLDQNFRPLSPGQEQEACFFVFLNVQPGSHVLYLRSLLTGHTGGVAVAVFPNVVTYLNLEHVNVQARMSGILYDDNDSEDDQLWPMGGGSVRVIGQPHTMATTDERGYFEMNGLVVVGTYPLYVETYKVIESALGQMQLVGYTHRYRINPRDMENQEFFRISRRQIKDWIQQLPQSLSAESGLCMIAFLPGSQLSSWMPVLNTLSVHASLQPLVYPLSAEGQLELPNPERLETHRLLGVQLPEGPALFQLLQVQSFNQIWSEMFFVSPGVVNVLGPYFLRE